MEWVKQAACRGRTDIDWLGDFVPAAAAELCSACPVSVECLEHAIEHHENKCDAGVWGGTSVSQRYEMRTRRNRERRAGHR